MCFSRYIQWLYRFGVCGHHAASSAPYRQDGGRQALHPHQPQEDQRGGVHPPAPDSGTDTRPLQHHGRHQARLSASEPWRDVVRNTRIGRCDRKGRKLVLPSSQTLLRNIFDFGGNTHRKHRQDDGPLRYKNNPAVRGGYGQENFKGHGQPDGGQNDVRNRQMVQKARIAKRNRL